MRNLAQDWYLHSQKWTFFNHARLIDLDPKNMKTSPRLMSILKELDNVYTEAKKREQQFYNDFGVTSAAEWSKKYLILGDSKNSKVLNIINSPDMIAILSTGGKNFEVVKNNFIKEMNEAIKRTGENSLSREIGEYIVDITKNSLAQDIGSLFQELGVLGNKKSSIKGTNFSNKDIQQMIFKAIPVKKIPQRVLTSANSEYLKYLRQSLTKVQKNERQRAVLAENYLQQQLVKDGRFSATEIKNILAAFKHEIKKNLQPNAENRLVSESDNLVIGEVSEVGEVIAYMDFLDPFTQDEQGNKIVNSIVTQMGRTLNKSNKKSKVDTIWTAPNGNKYNIQNKNSNADIYRQYQLMGTLESMTEYPTFLPLQSNVSFAYLLNKLYEYKALTTQEQDELAYLLINYNVLNKFADSYEDGTEKEKIAKGSTPNKVIEKKKEKGENVSQIPPALRTQAAVDQIMSKAMQYFMSDLFLPDGKKFTNGLVEKSNDFIIFMDRQLIPKSLIAQKLIGFLIDYKNETMRLYTTTGLKGFGQAQFTDMVLQKKKARMTDPEPDKYDYHNANLVQVGSDFGTIAANNLYVKKISLKFIGKNLVSQSLI